MFFKTGQIGRNEWWMYLLGFLIVILGYTLGQIPLMGALMSAVANDPELDMSDLMAFQEDPDFSNFGIDSNYGFFLMLLMFVVATIFLWLAVRFLHKKPWKSIITHDSKIKWSKILFGFGLWFLMTLILEGVNGLMNPEGYEFTFDASKFLPLLLLVVLILPIQTSFEEFLFRGYLMQGIGLRKAYEVLGVFISILLVIGLWISLYSFLPEANNEIESINSSLIWLFFAFFCILILIFLSKYLIQKLKTSLDTKSILRKGFKWIPWVITSVLFGLIHGMNPEVQEFGFVTMQIYYISAGLFLGLLAVMDDSIELSLGVHAATNMYGALIVGYNGAAIQTDTLFRTDDVNPTLMTIVFFVSAAVFYIICSKKYNWAPITKVFDEIILNEENEYV